jgi:hypothetical protein
MKKTLIALATAGMLAAGVAGAATTAAAHRGVDSQMLSPVQYAPNVAPNVVEDRWDDRSVAVNEREARIRARIERGMNDGRITPREGRRLMRQLTALEYKERAFMADGRLNRRETIELNRDLDRLAMTVRSQMRDDERR